MRQYRWADYLICLTPLPALSYLGLESYGIDYRAFYLAGKAALQGLNPYLNHIAISSNFYGPVNSELTQYSGWKYPPLATLIFEPLASIPYEESKNLFNLLSILIATATIGAAIYASQRRIPPIAILIASFSFPVLATIERGQVEIVLAATGTLASALIAAQRTRAAGIVIGLMTCFKIYPVFLAPALIRSGKGRSWQGVMSLVATIGLVTLLTLRMLPGEWITSFRERLSIPFDQVPGRVINELPAGSGIIEGTTTVRTADARNLIYSHDFVYGFGNPLLKRQPAIAALIGAAGIFAAMRINRRKPPIQQALALMPWINIANPLTWIMGITWYIPLFLYSYSRVSPTKRFILCLPLILPPALNASGYLAAAISLVAARLYQSENNESNERDTISTILRN